jgi:hypothetical protein
MSIITTRPSNILARLGTRVNLRHFLPGKKIHFTTEDGKMWRLARTWRSRIKHAPISWGDKITHVKVTSRDQSGTIYTGQYDTMAYITVGHTFYMWDQDGHPVITDRVISIN